MHFILFLFHLFCVHKAYFEARKLQLEPYICRRCTVLLLLNFKFKSWFLLSLNSTVFSSFHRKCAQFFFSSNLLFIHLIFSLYVFTFGSHSSKSCWCFFFFNLAYCFFCVRSCLFFFSFHFFFLGFARLVRVYVYVYIVRRQSHSWSTHSFNVLYYYLTWRSAIYFFITLMLSHCCLDILPNWMFVILLLLSLLFYVCMCVCFVLPESTYSAIFPCITHYPFFFFAFKLNLFH